MAEAVESGARLARELEAPGGTAAALVSGQFLALYLLHNDMTNMWYLWKRIAPAIRSVRTGFTAVTTAEKTFFWMNIWEGFWSQQANAERGAVWSVGQRI
ncbi:COP9 signalosome complex subunit 8 [Pipra filicauda]|uniref:COP9 signalosome complex subunit 8 n=1 Tax=Pipra filicauda TaxID=649802 RepID=A0A6J2HSU8_9PASS|nr:COP9 signalosome complex subunit 8 [Pipra filicauda]